MSRALERLKLECQLDEAMVASVELVMEAIADGNAEIAARWLRLDLRTLALALRADGLMPDAIDRFYQAAVRARELVRGR